MIYLFTGLPGSGKSYQLTKILVDKLLDGKNVYTNIDFDISGYNLGIDNYNNSFFGKFKKRKKLDISKYNFWENLPQYLQCTNGSIIWDEAHSFFNAREWEKMPPAWQRKISQHRKHGLDIYAAVQCIDFLEKYLRVMIGFHYRCKIVFQLFPKMQRPYFTFFSVSRIDTDSELEMEKKVLGRTYRIIRPHIANLYDTCKEIEMKK